jgi:hypothetical protein
MVLGRGISGPWDRLPRLRLASPLKWAQEGGLEGLCLTHCRAGGISTTVGISNCGPPHSPP